MTANKKLFLVDDEAVPARIIKTSLEREGYQVQLFRNGKFALEALRACQASQDLPDALITDIEMPVMTGEELCRHIQEEQPTRSYPIFVVTSVPDQIHREWTGEMPNVHFVEKPVSIKKLSSALSAALGDTGS